jgi:cytoskeletal protein CcmA (bactofilin family)
MFGSNKKTDSTKTGIIPTTSTHSLNSLVQGTYVEGKVKATNDIRIDGTIKGELDCEAKVIIGPSGVLEGTIRCKNAVVEGRFDGTLIVAELLNIRETAKVTGEVSYGKLNVQSGAVISGSYKLAGETSNGSVRPSTEAKKVVTTSKTDTEELAEKAQSFAKTKSN